MKNTTKYPRPAAAGLRAGDVSDASDGCDGVLDYLLERCGPARRAAGCGQVDTDSFAAPPAGSQPRAQRYDLVNYDPVTGLPNRTLFQDRVSRAMARARRGEMTVTLFLVDLRRFREINKHLGFQAGDQVLRESARRLEALAREVDTVAHLGGGRFALVLEGMAGTSEQSAFAEKVLRALDRPFSFEGREVFVSASIGISSYPPDATSPDGLLKTAEIALQFAKLSGGESYESYGDLDDPAPAGHFDVEMKLRRALDNGELAVWYQPKVDLRSGRITGAEALVRWNNPDLGMVSPARFIPLAEETGLILPIGEWVLNTACRQAKCWQDAGLDLEIAVNLSARQFRRKSLLGMVADALDRTGLDAERLELEITETMALARPEHAAILINSLRGLGVRIALDDFGAGWSSLSHLRRLPIDHIKIDRSFVAEIAHNAGDRAIVETIARLSHTLGLRITAEGVEDEAQAETVKACGCDQYQGYYFSKPLPADEFAALVAARAHDANQSASGQRVPT